MLLTQSGHFLSAVQLESFTYSHDFFLFIICCFCYVAGMWICIGRSPRRTCQVFTSVVYLYCLLRLICLLQSLQLHLSLHLCYLYHPLQPFLRFHLCARQCRPSPTPMITVPRTLDISPVPTSPTTSPAMRLYSKTSTFCFPSIIIHTPMCRSFFFQLIGER